jgi:hypothetical protein
VELIGVVEGAEKTGEAEIELLVIADAPPPAGRELFGVESDGIHWSHGEIKLAELIE